MTQLDINWLQRQVANERNAVVDHPLYQKVNSRDALRVFMEHHVFAVWDFMSLLKALQKHTTCVTVPWVPVGDAQARRLVNSIVLDEESDQLNGQSPLSHFEMYLAAMKEVGASTDSVEAFVERVAGGHLLTNAFFACQVPPAARQFVLTTMDLVSQDKPHALASAFTIGREDAIPEMFTRLLPTLPDAPTMRTYLERHIEVDGGEHKHHGFALVARLCGNSTPLWNEAAEAGRAALQARADLWDAIANLLS
jgi:hypothetical protein